MFELFFLRTLSQVRANEKKTIYLLLISVWACLSHIYVCGHQTPIHHKVTRKMYEHSYRILLNWSVRLQYWMAIFYGHRYSLLILFLFLYWRAYDHIYRSSLPIKFEIWVVVFFNPVLSSDLVPTLPYLLLICSGSLFDLCVCVYDSCAIANKHATI